MLDGVPLLRIFFFLPMDVILIHAIVAPST
jgi:hypothetical protein